MKYIALFIITLLITSCGISRDPCVHLYEWNYTDNEWYYKKDTRFQVYKTWRGRKFIYDLTSDSLNFRRVYIKFTPSASTIPNHFTDQTKEK